MDLLPAGQTDKDERGRTVRYALHAYADGLKHINTSVVTSGHLGRVALATLT